jgi:hypothetical protein
MPPALAWRATLERLTGGAVWVAPPRGTRWRDDQVLAFFIDCITTPPPRAPVPSDQPATRPSGEWADGARALFWWTFVELGPYGCLSFLPSHDEDDYDATTERQVKDASSVTATSGTEELFMLLAPALLWGDRFAREWAQMIPLDTAVEVVRGVCANLVRASQANNVSVAILLLRCLATVNGD